MTAPSAWRATRPVSSLRVFPPHSISTVFVLNIVFPSVPAAGCRPVQQLQASRPAAVRGAMWPHGRPAELRDRTYAKRPASGPLQWLLPEAELGDEAGIALFVLAAQIVEQRATLVDEHQEPAARMVVLGVGLEVAGQVVDALGEDRDLNFGRTGVALALRMFLD